MIKPEREFRVCPLPISVHLSVLLHRYLPVFDIFLPSFLSTLFSACLSVFLCQSVRSVCLSACLLACLTVRLSFCLSVFLPVCLPALLARLPVSLSVRLSVSHTWCAEGLMVSDTLHAVLPAGFAWNPRRVECGLNSIQSRLGRHCLCFFWAPATPSW
jgi:hypothetical protein